MSQPSWTGKLVTVGIVTWNSEKYLPTCLEGLAAQAYPSLEFIIVDNGSADRSVDLVRERLHGARIILNNSNEGYCRAHNEAIRVSKGEFYLALNPDVQLLPGYIDLLVAALEARPEAGSAVGKLWQATQSEPRLLDSTGLFIDRQRHQYLRGYGEPDLGQYDQAAEVFGADGAAPMHRRKMLEDVSIDGECFDQQFIIYMEDVDLAWRARLLGWSCWYEPRAHAFHHRSFKPGVRETMRKDIRRMAVRNRYLMILKNEARASWRRDWWRIVWYDVRIMAYMLVFERSSLGALRMLWRQWSRTKRLRKEIWKKARASEESVLTWFS